MPVSVCRKGLGLGLILMMVSTAPGPVEKSARPSSLAEERAKAATKQFNEIWTYYRQSRSDSFPVYYWSKLVLESQDDLSDKPADRLAAHQAHLERMQKLEALVKKVRKIGFGYSTDVGATEYYRIEAERLLEKVKGG